MSQQMFVNFFFMNEHASYPCCFDQISLNVEAFTFYYLQIAFGKAGRILRRCSEGRCDLGVRWQPGGHAWPLHDPDRHH